jgi:hypothetical protein
MNIDTLILVCQNLTIGSSYTTKDGKHDLTSALLELQICLEEMSKSKRKEIEKILSNL